MFLTKQIKQIIKKNKIIFSKLKKINFFFENQKIKIKNKKNLKNKSIINVCFFVVDQSLWKYDNLFKKLRNHPKFNPNIVIYPYKTLYEEKNRKEKLKEVEDFFLKRNYEYILDDTGEKNIKKKTKPDIIFYSLPYEEINYKNYNIDKFKDSLCCYIPYYIDPNNVPELYYDLKFHNLLWKFFLPTKVHLEDCKKYSRMKGKNAMFTGYPGIENYRKIWEKNKNEKKVIIWAPHQSLPDVERPYSLTWSTFYMYYNRMIDISDRYKDKIDFIFKPHPGVYKKLLKDWGKEKTDKYYEKWNNKDNRKIELGDYSEVFLRSDALIHDCNSFTIEYLATLKPVCRLVNKIDYKKYLNKVGIEAWECHELAFEEKDIINFIENVINGIDNKKEKKEKFYNKYFNYIEGNSPSELIIKELEKYI